MGKYTFGAVIALILTFCVMSFAELKGTPFQPHDDKRFDKIETLTDSGGIQLADGDIVVGDASGNMNAVTMSSDATIINTGALTLAANSVDSAEITAGSVDEDKIAVPTADGKNVMRVVRANLDCGVGDCSVGTISLGQTLPAKAVIYQSWWFTETQFVDGGSGTVALHCEDANNIFTAADITGNAAGSIIAGNATGVIATMTAAIAASCTITATIGTAEQSAGVLTLYVMYVVHD